MLFCDFAQDRLETSSARPLSFGSQSGFFSNLVVMRPANQTGGLNAPVSLPFISDFDNSHQNLLTLKPFSEFEFFVDSG